MDLVIPVSQTAGYRSIYTPQPSFVPQPTMLPQSTMIPQPMMQPSFLSPMYPQPSMTPMIQPYQPTPFNNLALTPIIPNENRALHSLSNKLNENTKDINEYSSKNLSEDNMRQINEMIDQRISKAISESPQMKSNIIEDVENVKKSEEIEEDEEEEEEEVINESEDNDSEIEEPKTKKSKKYTKRVTKKRTKKRKQIKKQRSKIRKRKSGKMRIKKSLLRNNIVANKSDEQLDILQRFYFENKMENSKIEKAIKRKIIPSLEVQKHKHYLENLSESDRELVRKFLNDKGFNKEFHTYIRNDLTNNTEMKKNIERLDKIIKRGPKLSREIIVFKDLNEATKLKKNNIYTESSVSVSRFNPINKHKGTTNTLSIRLPKMTRCLIISKSDIYNSGEILMPLSSRFKINNIRDIKLDNNDSHQLYQSTLPN